MLGASRNARQAITTSAAPCDARAETTEMAGKDSLVNEFRGVVVMYSVVPILILHLSDLHFGPNSRFLDEPPKKLGERFAHSVRNELSRKGVGQSISLVVISGDIAEAARPKEYEDAEVFFGTLAATLEVERRRFVFIPGNHDVSWPACKRAEADQEEQGFDDNELRKLIDRTKFLNFERFLDKFYGDSRTTATAAVTLAGGAFVYDFPQFEISVAGLNSCEAESHRRRDHKGLLSEAQAEALMKLWSQDEYSHWLKIITIHHNPVVTVKENIEEILAQLRGAADVQSAAVECYASDMVGFEGKEFLQSIAEDCEVQIILHGHHHAADKNLWPWSRGTAAGATQILSAGSGLLDQKILPRDHPNTFRLISLDPARETIKSWVLEYRPRARVKGSVTAGQFVAVDEPYERELSLPKKFPQARLLKNQATSSMAQVLEAICKNKFEDARKRLRELEKQSMDLPENLNSRTLYNRACTESAYAEGLPNGERALALKEATRYLERWIKNGVAGAWAREGKTERNEIHRILGHRNAGKSHTWNTLFNETVKTGKHARMLELRPNECVEVFLISGSPEERNLYAGDVLKNQDARIVLCSMQYVEHVVDTFTYIFEEDFWVYVQWLNPGHSDDAAYPDYLGLGNRLMFSGATITVRSGRDDATSRIRELREFIYGWSSFRRLIVSC
jgi:3',5'-cyclic AMP phosphodiesterase CpdA